MPSIRAKTGPNKGKSYEIAGTPLTIGREDAQTFQILDQGVSRAHAEIFRIGEMCFVRDLNSTNGTFVNSIRIKEESLKVGDEILIGTTVLVFEDDVPSHVSGEAPGVQFEGDEAASGGLHESTVELKVEELRGETESRPVGKEVQSRNLSLVSQIGTILRQERDLSSAFEKTLEVVCAALGAQHGYLFQVDRATGNLKSRAVVEVEAAGTDKTVSRTIVRRVIQTGMPLLTTNAALDERLKLSESVILKKIKSVICTPILTEQRAEGLLYFHSGQIDRIFTVEDLELATSVALQLSTAISGASANERLRKGLMATIRALVTAMEIADPKNQGHAQRAADYSAAVAAQLALSQDEIHKVRLAALLHDVGKLAVHPDVQGVGREVIKEQHVYSGEKILAGIEGFEEILPGVRFHHERADGSGYPYRVKNAETPVMARIIIVTNAFDNSCSWGGLGGQGIPAKDVIKDMAQRGGGEFDDDVVKALILCHRNGTLYASSQVPQE